MFAPQHNKGSSMKSYREFRYKLGVNETLTWDGSRSGDRFEIQSEKPRRYGRTSEVDLSSSGRGRSPGYIQRGPRSGPY